jgi:uncharacterized protein YhaN
VSRLRQEQKAHPKALQQLEKQKQVLEKKLDGQGRKEAALQRDNEALQVCLFMSQQTFVDTLLCVSVGGWVGGSSGWTSP